MLNAVRYFFCVYGDGHMTFILHVVSVVCHIDWSVVVEPFLHPGNKSTWSWCIILVVYHWNVFAKFCWQSNQHILVVTFSNPVIFVSLPCTSFHLSLYDMLRILHIHFVHYLSPIIGKQVRGQGFFGLFYLLLYSQCSHKAWNTVGIQWTLSGCSLDEYLGKQYKKEFQMYKSSPWVF